MYPINEKTVLIYVYFILLVTYCRGWKMHSSWLINSYDKGTNIRKRLNSCMICFWHWCGAFVCTWIMRDFKTTWTGSITVWVKTAGSNFIHSSNCMYSELKKIKTGRYFNKWLLNTRYLTWLLMQEKRIYILVVVFFYIV